jgi:hypothetical protein
MPYASLRLSLALPFLALAACGGNPSEEDNAQAAAEPTAPSSEWVEPNPTEPAVPVTLPSTAMTNVPEATPAAR